MNSLAGLDSALRSAIAHSESVWPSDIKDFSAFGLIGISWAAFILFWFFAAFSRKRTEKREPIERRLFLVAFMALAFFILNGTLFPDGILNGRFLPDLRWLVQLGALLTAAGIAFAIWARIHIGKNWSGQVTIKRDHQLVRTGPYARIRHPIYSGLLLAVLGTGLAIGEYRALAGFALILFGFIYKAKREEAILAEHFGPAFEEHKKLTGFFLPKFT